MKILLTPGAEGPSTARGMRGGSPHGEYRVVGTRTQVPT